MSVDILVRRALMRREAFRKLNERLKTIKDIVHSLILKPKFSFSVRLQRAIITTQAI